MKSPLLKYNCGTSSNEMTKPPLEAPKVAPALPQAKDAQVLGAFWARFGHKSKDCNKALLLHRTPE